MRKDSKGGTAKRRGRQFWVEQLRACERSGQSLHAYATRQGLDAHTAYRWRKRLRAEAEHGAGSGAQRWTRVQIEPGQRSSARYRVQLPNGIAVEIGGAIDAAELEQLLRVVVGR